LVKEIETLSPKNADAVLTTELLKRQWLSKNVFEIELSRPASFEFEAGHTIRFIHQSIERYYSLLSTPQDPHLALCVQHVPQGRFSPILANAEIGSRFEFTGPHGYFTFKPSPREPVFVATGAGIAPFVSIARSGIKNFTLFHEARKAEEIYYQSVFKKIKATYHPCLPSPETAIPKPEGIFQGHVADCIKANLPRKTYDFYLCGHGEMIRNVTLLADDRFTGSYVYTEVFF
jgi:ferredoxin-NADP reductase